MIDITSEGCLTAYDLARAKSPFYFISSKFCPPPRFVPGRSINSIPSSEM